MTTRRPVAAPTTSAMQRTLPPLLLGVAWLFMSVVPAHAVETSAGAPGEAPPQAPAATSPETDPRQYLLFVEEFTGACVSRNGVQVLIRNTHPTRTVRVWLDRYHAGQGTGDRSRSDLRPGGEPDPLGCSRNHNAPQEWRIVRAAFID